MNKKSSLNKNHRITIKEVAKAAGVSVATVSYVLNHTPGHTISLGTRMRVFEASRELGYLPNPYVRALGKRVSDEIAHVSFEPVKSYGMLEWVTLTQQRIQELGYTPGSYLYYGDSQDAMFEIYTGILARRPAAVITSKFLMTKEIYQYTKSVGVQACILFGPRAIGLCTNSHHSLSGNRAGGRCTLFGARSSEYCIYKTGCKKPVSI